MRKLYVAIWLVVICFSCSEKPENFRQRDLFTSDWKFFLGDVEGGEKYKFDDTSCVN